MTLSHIRSKGNTRHYAHLAVSDTRKPSCPICDGFDWEQWGKVRGVPLSRCSVCGVCATTEFLDGRQGPDTLYEVDEGQFQVYRMQYLNSRLHCYRKEMPKLEPYRVTGRLLEIGCGYGFFLEMASGFGWDATGVEISGYPCEIARSRGCRVHRCEVAEAPLPNESFDVVVMWDVIEHFLFPGEVLKLCAALLRSGGALVMKTPNARALCPTFNPGRALYREYVYPSNPGEHVFHFTPETLSALVRKLGFDRVEVRTRSDWEEMVISGNNFLVRELRRAVLRYAHHLYYPYEFVLTAVKA